MEKQIYLLFSETTINYNKCLLDFEKCIVSRWVNPINRQQNLLY